MRTPRTVSAVLACVVAVGCSESAPTAPGSILPEAPLATGPELSPAGSAEPQGAAPASARTIRIVQGSIDMPVLRWGTASLRGTQGFTLDATIEGASTINPGDICADGPICVPGFSVSLFGFWVASDLPATVKLRGKTFTDVGGHLSPTSSSLQVAGSFVAPPQAAQATVTAPFALSGRFQWPEGSEEFEASGTATVFLEWVEAWESWLVTASRFEIRGGR